MTFGFNRISFAAVGGAALLLGAVGTAHASSDRVCAPTGMVGFGVSSNSNFFVDVCRTNNNGVVAWVANTNTGRSVGAPITISADGKVSGPLRLIQASDAHELSTQIKEQFGVTVDPDYLTPQSNATHALASTAAKKPTTEPEKLATSAAEAPRPAPVPTQLAASASRPEIHPTDTQPAHDQPKTVSYGTDDPNVFIAVTNSDGGLVFQSANISNGNPITSGPHATHLIMDYNGHLHGTFDGVTVMTDGDGVHLGPHAAALNKLLAQASANFSQVRVAQNLIDESERHTQIATTTLAPLPSPVPAPITLAGHTSSGPAVALGNPDQMTDGWMVNRGHGTDRDNATIAQTTKQTFLKKVADARSAVLAWDHRNFLDKVGDTVGDIFASARNTAEGQARNNMIFVMQSLPDIFRADPREGYIAARFVLGHLPSLIPDKIDRDGITQEITLLIASKLPAIAKVDRAMAEDASRIAETNPILHLRRLPTGSLTRIEAGKLIPVVSTSPSTTVTRVTVSSATPVSTGHTTLLASRQDHSHNASLATAGGFTSAGFDAAGAEASLGAGALGSLLKLGSLLNRLKGLSGLLGKIGGQVVARFRWQEKQKSQTLVADKDASSTLSAATTVSTGTQSAPSNMAAPARVVNTTFVRKPAPPFSPIRASAPVTLRAVTLTADVVTGKPANNNLRAELLSEYRTQADIVRNWTRGGKKEDYNKAQKAMSVVYGAVQVLLADGNVGTAFDYAKLYLANVRSLSPGAYKKTETLFNTALQNLDKLDAAGHADVLRAAHASLNVLKPAARHDAARTLETAVITEMARERVEQMKALQAARAAERKAFEAMVQKRVEQIQTRLEEARAAEHAAFDAMVQRKVEQMLAASIDNSDNVTRLRAPQSPNRPSPTPSAPAAAFVEQPAA